MRVFSECCLLRMDSNDYRSGVQGFTHYRVPCSNLAYRVLTLLTHASSSAKILSCNPCDPGRLVLDGYRITWLGGLSKPRSCLCLPTLKRPRESGAPSPSC